MKLLSLITLFHNWITDKDFVWWPFSFLRPRPEELMTLKLTAMMTGCFGGLATLMFAVLAIANNAFSFQYFLSIMLSSLGGFFIWFSCITKPLWNRRARELQK